MRAKILRRCVLASFGVCLVGLANPWAAESAATFKTVNGEVVIEAENYSRLGGTKGGTWYANTARAGYLGAGYMQSATNDPSTLQFSADNSRVEYDIDFKESGAYYLFLRTSGDDETQNGFFATIDGKPFTLEHVYGPLNPFYVWVLQPSVKWTWYTDAGGAEARSNRVYCTIATPGVHTVAIHRRDKGTRLDRIWLSKHQTAMLPKRSPDTATDGAMTDPSVFLNDATPQVASPVFNPPGATFDSSVNLTISCATAGATIFYRTDSTDPTAQSYHGAGTSPRTLTLSASATVKARAYKAGMNPSAVASATFTKSSGTPTSRSFAPSDDAYLENSTLVNTDLLRVENNTATPRVRTAYLKFAVSGLDGAAVQSATLRMKNIDTSARTGTYTLSLGSQTAWTESTLSSANKPSPVQLLETKTGSMPIGTVFAWNVSGAVAGEGTYTFILHMDANAGNDLAFSSRTGTQAPELVVSLSGSTPPPPATVTMNALAFPYPGTFFYNNNTWLAIDPENTAANPSRSATVSKAFPGASGTYAITLHGVGENDGRSRYRLSVAGTQVGEFLCPLSTLGMEEGPAYTITWTEIPVTAGATITLWAQCGTVDNVEWSRGRWSKLVFE
ncbi:MAG: chitobiase/beta-hexosaminidase C-terminal domain-containing protein, partial [Kiritimatiellae bacterium]|nr:chitobiase/beta-hexosaminidase C-terminal domain-containing protein [Kiritimatiellia bacterium]